MESSFRKRYEKTPSGDGFVLRYRGSTKENQRQAKGGMIFLLLFGGFWVAFIVGLMVWGLLGQGDFGRVVGGIVGIALFFWMFMQGWQRTFNALSSITVTKAGLKFFGKQLPFADIQSFGIKTSHYLDSVGSQSSWVIAKSHGQEIRLTSFVDSALAEILLAEIQNTRV